MKKIILSILCLASLYGETTTSFFLGFGGGYSTGSKVFSTGPNIVLDGKLNNTLRGDFIKYEALLGFETFFSNRFGVRYYVNLGKGDPLVAEKDKYLGVSELGLSFDFLFKFPIDESLAFRFYSGINLGSYTLLGGLAKIFKDVYDEELKAQGNFEMRYTNGLSFKSLNLGMHLLFGKNHVIEFGSRIPLERSELAIFQYRQTVPPKEKSKVTFSIPYVDLSLKYILVF